MNKLYFLAFIFLSLAQLNAQEALQWKSVEGESLYFINRISFSSPLAIFKYISTDFNGNLYSVGGIQGFNYVDSISINRSTFEDFYLLKRNKKNTADWGSVSNGFGREDANHIAVAPNGDAFVYGTYGTATSIGHITLNNPNLPWSSNIFVAKYDINGQLLWASSFTGGIAPSSIVCGPNGSVLLMDFTVIIRLLWVISL
jgi:hypothetical protein